MIHQAVFDTMRHIRPNVSTVCVGLAASMGLFNYPYSNISDSFSPGAFLLASGEQVFVILRSNFITNFLNIGETL